METEDTTNNKHTFNHGGVPLKEFPDILWDENERLLTFTVGWFAHVPSRLPDKYARMMELATRLQRTAQGFLADRHGITIRVAEHVRPEDTVRATVRWFERQLARE